MQEQSRRYALAVMSVTAAIGILTAALVAEHLPEVSQLSAALLLGNGAVVQTASRPEPSAPSAAPEQPESAQPASSAAASSAPAKIAGKVKESDLSGNGNLSAGSIRMTSKSASKIDLAQMLADTPDLTLSDTLEPQVLIYHTHTTEGYMTDFTGTYPEGYNSRTRDTSRNVVGVGDIITEKLNAAGIVTIHDTQIYDDPQYTGAYGRSMKTVQALMAQYPSIKVVLDVHRDAIQQGDGSLLKPTTTINGKKAAQIMLVSGCDDKGTLGFPNWRKNLTFAAHLQRQLVNDWTTLARPIYCWNVRYNATVSPTALLVEFGSDSNTADEVMYSAELFADSLIDLLQDYIKTNG